MALITLGTVALDNVRTASGYRKKLLGGSAAHFSMSAHIFTEVHLVSIIGEDFPKEHLDLLGKKQIDTQSIERTDGKTFQWEGEYKKGDYNTAITLATELGVLGTYEPKIEARQRGIEHAFLANFDPDIQMAFLKLLRSPKLVGLDSMNLWIDIKRRSLKRLLKKVDLFVLNDGEAMSLTGEGNMVKAAKCLRRMGPRLICIKKGEHGVFFYSDQFMFGFPAFPVERVIDPTGAGDTFAGGLMGYLTKVKRVNEKVLRKAVLYATTLASFNVEGFGVTRTAGLSLPRVHERSRQLTKFMDPISIP